MLEKLETKHGIEVWINKKLEEVIEREYKKFLGSDKLCYYAREMGNNKDLKNKVKWFGEIGLINFLRKVLNRNHLLELNVTKISNKGNLINYINQEDEGSNKVYWMGDFSEGFLLGDDLLCALLVESINNNE